MRDGESGWFASLLGAAVLIAGGFALGLVSGAIGWAGGDFNGDSTVDTDDLNNLALNWRRNNGTMGAAVPEPATVQLLIFCCAMAGLAARQRTSRSRQSRSPGGTRVANPNE